jgi:hypothetical protein
VPGLPLSYLTPICPNVNASSLPHPSSAVSRLSPLLLAVSAQQVCFFLSQISCSVRCYHPFLRVFLFPSRSTAITTLPSYSLNAQGFVFVARTRRFTMASIFNITYSAGFEIHLGQSLLRKIVGLL